MPHAFETWFGTSAEAITWWQMSLRAGVVVLFGLLLLRLFGGLAFAKRNPLSIVVAIIVGSNLSRAITGNAPLGATLAATGFMVFGYWLFQHAAARLPLLGRLTKGAPSPLVEDGRINESAMKRAGLSHGDLEEAMRLCGETRVEQVKLATVERNGAISIVPKDG